ncbi:MAG: hypothetical protein P8L85_20370, partial [Rubripirellula sp.]|nr:hypothetical protein [Rubripirellula sp.]
MRRLPCPRFSLTGFLASGIFIASLSATNVVVSAQENETAAPTAAADTDWTQAGFWQTLDGKPPEECWDFTAEEIRLERPRGRNGSL